MKADQSKRHDNGPHAVTETERLRLQHPSLEATAESGNRYPGAGIEVLRIGTVLCHDPELKILKSRGSHFRYRQRVEAVISITCGIAAGGGGTAADTLRVAIRRKAAHITNITPSSDQPRGYLLVIYRWQLKGYIKDGPLILAANHWLTWSKTRTT